MAEVIAYHLGVLARGAQQPPHPLRTGISGLLSPARTVTGVPADLPTGEHSGIGAVEEAGVATGVGSRIINAADHPNTGDVDRPFQFHDA
jgi:hypothetical protein